MTESAFFTKESQLEWLIINNKSSIRDLIETFEITHKQLFHDVFLAPATTAIDEKYNCRRHEALEDIATILLSRGALPPQYEAYALDPQDLPWMPKNTRTLPSKLFKS